MIVDLHAHPTMKTYFAGASLLKRGRAAKGFNPFRLRTSYPALLEGGVDVVLSSIYVPEAELASDCWVISAAASAIPRLRAALRQPPDQTAFAMMAELDEQVRLVNGTMPARRLAQPGSWAELDAAIDDGCIALIKTLEGAHALAGDPANVRRFREAGVCSITLAHFYPNEVAFPVEGIPDDMPLRNAGCFRSVEDATLGLGRVGHQVVEEMLDAGVIVDLTHSTLRARAEALAVPNPRGRPFTLTHTGVAALNDVPMNVTDAEVRTIANGGGVIGIIFYNYWLRAGHSGLDSSKPLLDTLEHLLDTGGEDCVAFGSDWDGMTDPPDDLRSPEDLPDLRERLSSAGFSSRVVDKFMGQNALRMLREGWS